MSEELSEDQKRRIEAEELHRAQIEDRVTRKFQKSRGLGCVGCVVILLIVAVFGIVGVVILSAINIAIQ